MLQRHDKLVDLTLCYRWIACIQYIYHWVVKERMFCATHVSLFRRRNLVFSFIFYQLSAIQMWTSIQHTVFYILIRYISWTQRYGFYWQINGRRDGQTLLLRAIFNWISPFGVCEFVNGLRLFNETRKSFNL